MRTGIAVIALATFLTACGGGTSTAPSASMAPVSIAGTWIGSGSDSSSSLGPGSMMGQAGPGAMTWHLTQNGPDITGSLGVTSMHGQMPGTFTGTFSNGQLTFTFDMPMDGGDMHGMMPAVCAVHVTGAVQFDPATMTMTGTYGGSNTCFGAFTNGHLSLTRQ